MGERPLELLKSTADAYSYLLDKGNSCPNEIRLLRERLGFFDSNLISNTENDIQFSNEIESKNTEHVGIWELRNNNGKKSYVRDYKYIKEFELWARIPKIPAKSNKLRVVYLGESAARGFLYDPFFTPAAYLEKILNVNLKGKEAEVIDLARVNLLLPDLMELCNSCISLEPDIIIIFAGNNWRESIVPSGQEIKELEKVIDSEKRFDYIYRFYEKKFENRISKLYYLLKNISEKNNIPIVFVIPAFNLKDWKSNSYNSILTLANGRTGEWIEYRNGVEAALKEGSINKAEELANKMVEINKASPVGYTFLAECCLKKGLTEKAGYYFEKVIDTSIYYFEGVPACTTMIRNILLNENSSSNIKVVNLPELFKRHSEIGIPGNDLFLDYCHLSYKGIQVAMKNTAQLVLSILNDTDMTAQSIEAVEADISSDIIAKAHFFAAIHCAHRGEQPYEILYYHCMKAIQASESIITNMKQYVDIATRKVPWNFNKHYEKMFEEGISIQYPSIFQPDNQRIMDIELVKAIVDSLYEYGINIKKETDDLRIKEHMPVSKPVSLLESYYTQDSYLEKTHLTGLVYVNAYKSHMEIIDTKTAFYLIAHNSNDFGLELTFRTPFSIFEDKKIVIKINNVIIGEIAAQECWKNTSLIVHKELLNEDGVNIVLIEWPLIDQIEDRIKRDYERRYSDMDLIYRKSKPIHGEIAQFNVRCI